MMGTIYPAPGDSHRRRASLTALAAAAACLAAARLLAGETHPAADPVPVAAPSGAVAARAPSATGTGRITGMVNLGPRLATRQVRFHLYPDAVAAKARRAASVPGDELKNVVVYVESAPGLRAPVAPAPIPSIRQEDLTFVPHVLAITRGTEVEFPNTDPVFHNVFSLSHAASFDLGRYPKGSSKRVRFDTAGIVKVFCHIHSDMSAVIVVLDSPFFASPAGDGRYAIDGLPPGDYVVTGWHERAHPVTRRVHVEEGKDAVADFNIPIVDDNPE